MINVDKKIVMVISILDNEIKEYFYDKLILSFGVKLNNLLVLGVDLENVYLMCGYNWVIKIKEKLNDFVIKKIVVVGVGYIGIEVVEVSWKVGKEVVLFDVIDRFLGIYLDVEMIDILE